VSYAGYGVLRMTLHTRLVLVDPEGNVLQLAAR